MLARSLSLRVVLPACTSRVRICCSTLPAPSRTLSTSPRLSRARPMFSFWPALSAWACAVTTARLAATGSSAGVSTRRPAAIFCWVSRSLAVCSFIESTPRWYKSEVLTRMASLPDLEDGVEQRGGDREHLSGGLVGLLVAQEVRRLFVKVDAGNRFARSGRVLQKLRLGVAGDLDLARLVADVADELPIRALQRGAGASEQVRGLHLSEQHRVAVVAGAARVGADREHVAGNRRAGDRDRPAVVGNRVARDVSHPGRVGRADAVHVERRGGRERDGDRLLEIRVRRRRSVDGPGGYRGAAEVRRSSSGADRRRCRDAVRVVHEHGEIARPSARRLDEELIVGVRRPGDRNGYPIHGLRERREGLYGVVRKPGDEPVGAVPAYAVVAGREVGVVAEGGDRRRERRTAGVVRIRKHL